MRIQRQRYGLLLAALVAGLGAEWSSAQSYPTKPVRILTSSPGGGNDTVARMIAGEITIPLAQQVIVDNRPSGNPLAMAAAKAPPDGYTLMIVGSTMWIAGIFEDIPYDPLRDYAPIAPITRTPYFLVVNPAVPVKSVDDLVRLAKAQPGKLNYSSGPNGSSTHISGELFKTLTGTDIVRISYKGGPQEFADLLANQVQMTFGPGATWAPHIKAGKMRVLAATGSARSALYPDLPTLGETIPGYVSEALNAFFAPAKTPDAIVRRLNQETVRALEKPDVRQRLMNGGQEAAGGSPEQLTEAMKAEIARVAKLAKDVGMKPGA